MSESSAQDSSSVVGFINDEVAFKYRIGERGLSAPPQKTSEESPWHDAIVSELQD